MRFPPLRLEFSLLRQGVSVGWEFGARSLEELAAVGEFLEHCVYEPGSLRRAPDGLAFTLRNPPLRMGAFSSIRVLLDGVAVPAGSVTLLGEGATTGRRTEAIDPAHPFAFAFGRRTEFHLRVDPPAPGDHRIRLELQSVAVPPLVWFEFAEPVAEERP
jgi:hypothetical protein